MTAYAAIHYAPAADLYAAVALCLQGRLSRGSSHSRPALTLNTVTPNVSESGSAIKLQIIVWPHGEPAHGV